MKDVVLKKLIEICKKYLGEEETKNIINEAIQEELDDIFEAFKKAKVEWKENDK